MRRYCSSGEPGANGGHALEQLGLRSRCGPRLGDHRDRAGDVGAAGDRRQVGGPLQLLSLLQRLQGPEGEGGGADAAARAADPELAVLGVLDRAHGARGPAPARCRRRASAATPSRLSAPSTAAPARPRPGTLAPAARCVVRAESRSASSEHLRSIWHRSPGQRHGRQATRFAQSDSSWRRARARISAQASCMARAMSDSSPTLWHISVSHYSEKARWALDHKRGPAQRRAVADPGPAHPGLDAGSPAAPATPSRCWRSTAARIGDSTEIIAALEERFPERPLYPADPEQRRRALELEDFFDEELGPHIRLLAFHELGKDPERFEAVIARTTPGPVDRASAAAPSPTPAPTPACASASAARRRPSWPAARSSPPSTASRPSSARTSTWSATPSASPTSPPPRSSSRWSSPTRDRVPTDEPPPAGIASFRAPLEERPGYRWVEETFRRHRRPAGVAVAA